MAERVRCAHTSLNKVSCFSFFSNDLGSRPVTEDPELREEPEAVVPEAHDCADCHCKLVVRNSRPKSVRALGFKAHHTKKNTEIGHERASQDSDFDENWKLQFFAPDPILPLAHGDGAREVEAGGVTHGSDVSQPRRRDEVPAVLVALFAIPKRGV